MRSLPDMGSILLQNSNMKSLINKNDKLVKSRKVPLFVIPAPHRVRDKLHPESGLLRYLQMLWTPVFTGVTTFLRFHQEYYR